jgi:class 3 adenylate cyclase
MSGAWHQMFGLARLVPGRDHVAVPPERKNLARPDEVIRLPEVVEEVVDLGELTVGRTISHPTALRCAAAVRDHARDEDVGVRAGVHVAEVELVGDDVRGMGVHEAARIMAQAAEGEILVSDTTRALARAAGLGFEDRGTLELKGLDGQWALCTLVA